MSADTNVGRVRIMLSSSRTALTTILLWIMFVLASMALMNAFDKNGEGRVI